MARTGIVRAARILKQGGVIAYPTEAVFGLGCDPQNLAAVERILHIKRRAPNKGLILIASDFSQLKPYLGFMTRGQTKQLQATWPGPVTWVVPAAEETPALLTGGRDTIAVRVSAHPTVQALCKAFGGAIVSTSANRSAAEPAREAFKCRVSLGAQLDFIVSEKVGDNPNPTEIRDLKSGEILRKG